jgi:hypothetical protein
MSRAREVSKIVLTVENFDAVEYSSTPPANPQTGALWVDTSTVNPLIKAYNGNDWDTLGSAPVPIITGIAPSNISGSASTAIIVNGTNFESGSIVKLVDNEDNELHVLSTTFNNSQSLQFLTPVLTASAGPYDIKVTNTDNQFSIFENSLDVGSAPVWSTPPGSLGLIYDSLRSSSTFSLLATDLDNQQVFYEIVSGSLPSGMSLTSSGVIFGTAQAVSSDTTYAFTVRAKDTSNNFTDRSFSITTKAPVVQSFTATGTTSWISPITSNVRVLVVGGGASGDGGGGGAGAVIHHTSYPVVLGNSYTVIVGSGGVHNGSNGSYAGAGAASTFGNIVANGGGPAGYGNAGRVNTANGSGGGGAYVNLAAGTAGNSVASGGTIFVSNGGAGGSSTSAGGGGGAGGVGGNAQTSTLGGAGGIGISNDITGSPIFYGGGGGGGGNGGVASGGVGGGGNGANAPGQGVSSGLANTGGGGGGVYQSYPPGNGGSGIVIIRY